jgi:hypothetical protein
MAEGDRNVRNSQVQDAAFDYWRPVNVNNPEGVVLRYRLTEARALPINGDGTVDVPGVMRAGAVVLRPESKQAKEGAHVVTHFAEIQAIVAGRAPSRRMELTADLEEVYVMVGVPWKSWQAELQFALADLRRHAPEEYIATRFLEHELARLTGEPTTGPPEAEGESADGGPAIVAPREPAGGSS